MPDIISQTIRLSGQRPLAEGKESIVYQHPEFLNVLLKVPRQQSRHFRAFAKPGLKRYAVWRYRGLINWYREYEEYLAAVARSGDLPGFLPRLFGFSRTDLGPAFAVERISGPDGEPAPTLIELARAGRIDDHILRLVDELFDQIAESGLVTQDLHAGNIVWSGDPDRLVLIEGLGDRVLIRVRVFSKRARLRTLARDKQALLAKLRELSPE
ncbi:hypothetical protein PSM7751_01019 [Pseudooceanicola marinus]|uniref:PhoP regulatory network protein YrbL n=1 Tax=Pseudooceanicola marinus TaxID=396013 RepID=A0A1X6YPU6_9RHOB|nr:YrbL family protein [Pseudooceanicola marinus]SLN27085.1 hypothetical protein PSM7751_01019 [Pseudooceanicola marinus]